jgi:tetratricopeptide (TPR) repeat protein
MTRRSTTLIWTAALTLSSLLLTPSLAQQPPSPQHPTDPPPAQTPLAPPPHFWLNLLDPQRHASEHLMRHGAQAFKREHFITALRSFEEAALRSPHMAEAHLFAGLVAARLKQHTLAVEHFEAFRAAYPTADATHDLCFHLAISLSHLNLWDQTISEYDRCLAATPPDSPRRIIYLGNLAETYMATGRLDDAIRTYEATLTFDKGLVHALLGLGVALDRAQQPARSREVLRLGLLQDPALEEMTSDDVFFIPPGDGYFHLGLMLETLGRVEDARRYYAKFIAHLPNSPYLSSAQAHLASLASRPDALIKTLPSPSSLVSAAAVDASLSWLAIGTSQGQLTLLNLHTLAVTTARADGPPIIDLAFTPDASEVRALLADATLLRLGPPHKPKPLSPPTSLGAPASLSSSRRALSLSADASTAVIFQAPNTLELWSGLSLSAPPPPSTITSPLPDPLMAAAPSAHPTTIASDAPRFTPLLFVVQGKLARLQPLTPNSPPVATPHSVGFTDAEVSPDASLVVSSTHKGLIIFRADGSPIHLLLPSGDPSIQAVTLDPSGRYATAVTHSAIHIWDLSLLPPP